jgi:uncharacterized short protein YbdD (DUF466 family)
LIQYIDVEIKCIDLSKQVNPNNSDKISHKTIVTNWTTSKRALIELIYALHQAECFNNGKTPLKDLILLFSKVFHVALPDFHSSINRMKERNPVSPVKSSRAFFLDELTSEFNQKLESLDG